MDTRARNYHRVISRNGVRGNLDSGSERAPTNPCLGDTGRRSAPAAWLEDQCERVRITRSQAGPQELNPIFPGPIEAVLSPQLFSSSPLKGDRDTRAAPCLRRGPWRSSPQV